jgi:type IV pilus assembly protein PilB
MSESNFPITNVLANHLIQDGLLDSMTARKVINDAQKKGLSFLHYLVQNKFIEGDEILNCCKKHFDLPIFHLREYDFHWLTYMNHDLIHRYRILPLYKKNNILHIGISDPTEQSILDIITFHTGLKTSPVLVSEDQLDKIIQSLSADQKSISSLELLEDISNDENPYVIQEHSLNKDEPLIKWVDQMIHQAIQQSVSDIHIEPFEKSCRIRYRRDGILYQSHDLPINVTSRLIARLKIMAKLDITERRLPQDGRFDWHSIDIRINTCPTQYGEKIVLRLLDASKISLDYKKLGFSNDQQTLFINKISAPQGLILVTGPTGSGKTVTLYSALQFLNTIEKNISTVEDPIEIQLQGINQININPKINLDFSAVLKTLLRQDPDILMIGEIRDQETAKIAIQAAETGHLVLSTLHSNNAIETIHRFKSLNHSIYDFINAVTLIIAQRLVRILCDDCKIQDTDIQNTTYLLENNNQSIFRAVGCPNCLNGYRGRMGLYELLPLTDKMRQMILSKGINTRFKKESVTAGYTTLLSAGIEKIYEGKTSILEIQRVLQT